MKKYSEYDEYRQRVGKFLPNLLNFRNAGPGDFSDKKAPKAITDE